MSATEIGQDLERVWSALAQSESLFVERLRAAVRIPSVSNDPELHPECLRMSKMLERLLREVGADSVECHDDTGFVTGPNKETVRMPPIVTATFGQDSKKKTLCAYAHYDVMPATTESGWTCEPFDLVEKDGFFWGRGASDDKGPLMSWVAVLDAYRTAGVELPVNLKVLFEGREEAGSNGLEEFVRREVAEGKFMSDVDYVVISDSGAIGTKPCLTYGLRGIVEFTVNVEGPAADLHSGLFGGAVREPMQDLLKVLSSLHDNYGEIAVKALHEMVPRPSDAEKKRYESIEFEPTKWLQESKIPGCQGPVTTENILMRRWRYPTLTVHGIQTTSDYYATCIPAKCESRFSIRTVPNMKAQEVVHVVREHLNAQFASLKSPNTMEVTSDLGCDWFLGDVDDASYSAARRAHVLVHGAEPDLICEGGSIPITISLAQLTGKSVCLLPICGPTDNIHGPDENILRRNLTDGAKLMAAYLQEIAH